MGGRLAVGGGRALVEDKARPALAQLERLLEGVLFLPQSHERFLELRETDPAVYLFEHQWPGPESRERLRGIGVRSQGSAEERSARIVDARASTGEADAG